MRRRRRGLCRGLLGVWKKEEHFVCLWENMVGGKCWMGCVVSEVGVHDVVSSLQGCKVYITRPQGRQDKKFESRLQNASLDG